MGSQGAGSGPSQRRPLFLGTQWGPPTESKSGRDKGWPGDLGSVGGAAGGATVEVIVVNPLC